MSILIKESERVEDRSKIVKTVLMLILTWGFVLIFCGVGFAENVPLNTTHNGTVSGDLYVNATQPVAFADQPTSATMREFNQTYNLPTNTGIQWGEVYVNIYSGSGSANWPSNATILLDGDGDGVYETILGNELLTSDEYSADGTQYWINNHCFRVYSDYQLWYDVTGLISCINPSVYVKTEQVGTESFDGRLKMITLIVAYNDGDGDVVDYWVNDGQDWINSGTSQTTFATNTVTANVDNATLTTVALSSKDGTYTFNGQEFSGTDPVAPVNYFEAHTWDVTSNATPGTDSILVYGLGTGSSFKNVLATLVVHGVTVALPVADFVVIPAGGSAPLTVNFTDTSSSSPTSWFWDFGDGFSSTDRNPVHTYSVLGSYTVKLTVANVAGSNTVTKTGCVTVTEPTGPIWASKTGWNLSDIGNWTSPCCVDLDGDGDGDLLVGCADGVCYGYENTGTVANPVWVAKSVWNVPDVGNYARPCSADLDDDGDYDLLIGEVNGYIYFYNNTGTAVSPVWTKRSILPDVGDYSAPCLVDLDGDGDYDLLVGTNVPGTTYGYENTGSKSSPKWTAKSAWNAPVNVIGARPCCADLDGDGDCDLLIGCGDGVTYAYENTGTTNSPVWAARSAWNTVDVGDRASPYLADLDSDGDYDLLIGSTEGVTYAYENMGFSGGVPDLTPSSVAVLPSVVNVPCTVTVTVNNIGTTSIGAFVADFAVNGVVMDTKNVLGPAAGSSSLVNFSWTPTAVGDYNLTVTIDPNSGIIESDEANNVLVVPITVIADTEAPTVSASPLGGESSTRVQVVLSAADTLDANPQIYYTTNGDEPTMNSAQYTAPITVTQTTILKFIAVDASGNVSTMRSETYIINDTETPTVSASPTGGTFTNKTEVILTATDNIDLNPAIYYTLNGDEPTNGSTQYTGPFFISGNTTNTLKFIAVDAMGNTSPVQTEVYTMVPDLSVIVSVTNYPISKNKVSVTVNNSDAADVGAFNVTVQIGENTTTTNIQGLVAGSSTKFNVIDVKRQLGDNFTVNVMVDPENVITEANETNNSYSSNVTVATTGERYQGGRFSVGQDLVNNTVYAEGPIGVRVLGYGGYHWFDGTGTATWTASDLNIPEGATIISARLYQARTWYGYPDYIIQFNGHDTQQPIGYYWDAIAGQNVFDVSQYFNLYGDNTAVITGGNVAYGTILIVIYEAASEPYRQIWINEGADCLFDGYGMTSPPYVQSTTDPYVGYTMIDNASTNSLASAKVTVVTPSGEAGDSDFMYFNGQVFNQTDYNHSVIDPGIHYFDVTSALQNGTNELGVIGHSYLCYTISVVEVTKAATEPVTNFTANITSGTVPLQVQFTDTSSNSPTSWLWEYDLGSGWTTFISGTDSAAQNPLYTFITPGTYNIRLTASNSAGSDDEIKLGFLMVNPLGVINTRTGQTYNNIQNAIDDALTLGGDTITLQEGIYTENITISKQLTLNTTGAVTIQAANTNLPVITVDIAGSGSTITGFTITGATNSSGINLESADGCNITDNVIGGNSVGIKLYNSNSNTFQGNTIQNNGWAGICMDQATNNTINNANIVSNNQEGVFLANNSNGNIVEGNNIHDNTGMGVSVLSNSAVNTIQNNNASHNGVMGIFIQNSNNNIISNNSVQNNGWAGICLDNASGNTINNTNTVTGNQEGVFLANNSNGNIITGNNVHDNMGVGISILKSNNNQILSNTASSNGVMGVFVQNSSTITVQGNSVENSGWAGICLDQATGNTINANTVTGNQEGVFLANNSDSNIIGGNQVNSNIGDGLSVLNANSNIATGNQFQGNGVSGMFIQNSNGTIANQNTIESNGWGGIILDTATNTTVYQNNFQNNPEQALAVNGSNNKFYQETTGNYYSDWNITDPRPVDGNENIYDQYPSLTVF